MSRDASRTTTLGKRRPDPATPAAGSPNPAPIDVETHVQEIH